MSSLGEELEIEILLRVEVKSLMRFKCVQRSWNDIIKSPFFVNRRSKLHQKHSLLLISKFKPNTKLLLCDREESILIKSLFGNNNIVRIKSHGSCNGVFCLQGNNELIMWNPTTRQVHPIPHSQTPFSCVNTWGYDISLYGFGAVNDDFKVVKLGIFNDGIWKKMFYIISAEVYSLSTKSWTSIVNVPPSSTTVTHRQPSRYNTLVNGVYHWITTSYLDVGVNILCFDFYHTQFRQLTGPISRLGTECFYDDLVEIKGCLGYVKQYGMWNATGFEIWVMDQNVWTKKYNMNPIMSMFNIYGVWKDGDEILGGKVGGQLQSYDYHGNSLRQFQIYILEKNLLWIYDYVPCIAPLSK